MVARLLQKLRSTFSKKTAICIQIPNKVSHRRMFLMVRGRPCHVSLCQTVLNETAASDNYISTKQYYSSRWWWCGRTLLLTTYLSRSSYKMSVAVLYISIATNQHIHTITWLNKHQSLGRRGSWDEEEEKKKYRRESFLGIYWMAWSLTELDNTWQIQKNKKFSVPPRDPTCMHRKKVVVI